VRNTATISAQPATALGTRWWLEPLAMWGATRLVAVLAIYLGAALLPCADDYRRESPAAGAIDDLPAFYRSYAEDPGALGQRPFVGLRVRGEWSVLDPLVRWDAFWYLSVVEVGYVADATHSAQQNVAFFPAYPLAIRACRAAGIPAIPGALLVSNVALALAACLFYRFTARRFSVTAARWTVGLWLLYPTSFFGAVPYSESLAALGGVLWLAEIVERRYSAGGFWAGVASSVRPQGVLMGLPCWEGCFTRGRRREALVGLALCGLGLAGYMAYLWWQFGDPFLFAEVQRYWRPEASATWNPLRWLLLVMSALAFPLAAIAAGEPSLLLSSRTIDPWLLVWAAAWLPAVYRRLGWGLALTTGAMFVVPLATGGLASFGRFTWLMLPVFLVSGIVLATNRARWIVAGAYALLLVWLAALYGGYWMVI
jgi:Mannosyltransferase (PIG-V)